MADDLKKMAEAAEAARTPAKGTPFYDAVDALAKASITFKDAATSRAVLDLYARAEAAEAALSAAREEVERLLSAMKREEDYLLRMIEAEDETGGLMISDVQGAFHRIRDKDSDDMAREDEAATLTKEPTDV